MGFKIDYLLMQVKSIAEYSKGSILQYYRPSLKRLSLQLWTFFEIFYFLFKSFVKVELNYVFTINLFTMAENCAEKWIIL